METSTKYPDLKDVTTVLLKKMLFVDDRSKRIHWALDNYGFEYDITIACNVPEALRHLSSQDWDVVDLDHDLNGRDFEDPESTGCGMEIVRYIQKTGWPHEFRKEPQFWVHSSNLFATHLLMIELTKLGFHAWYKPIYYEKVNMTYDSNGLPR